MARYLLLHGAGGIGFDHWLVWLSTELRVRGHDARMRKLPDPRRPLRAPWQATMSERFAALAGAVAEGTAGDPSTDRGVAMAAGAPADDELIVVAHSLSTLLWLLHAGDVGAGHVPPPVRRADRVMLVTPPHLPADVGDSGWAMPDPAVIDPAILSARTRVAVSRNDRYWPDGGSIEALVEPLGLPLDDLGKAGHVEPADGYGPWPAMLAWCLGEVDAVTPNP